MFDQRLIRKINQGRAFALIGSGPSSEMGYPTWKSLAIEITEELKRQNRLSDEPSYSKYLAQGKYPELFSQAQRDLGGREQLVVLLSKLLNPPAKKRGYTYEILANWPFACYLTTNWDDEIQCHLAAQKVYFTSLQNSGAELAQVRSDASRLIIKLHSDLAHKEQAVITADDYSALHGSGYEYLRNRLRAIFEMFDVLIVGHSLTDPDLNLILQVAKQSAHPEHPVFFIAANLTQAEIRDHLNRYNIVAITYQDTDGTHSQLRRTLSLFDRFIVPRHKRLDLKQVEYTPSELEAAQAVAIYRRLAMAGEAELSPTIYLEPLILRSLQKEKDPSSLEQLLKISPLSSACQTEAVRIHVQPVLQVLQKAGLVEEKDNKFKLTSAGAKRTDQIAATHSREIDQAYGQFTVELQSRYADLKNDRASSLVQYLRDILVKVFKQRGLSMANAIIAGQSWTAGALSDVFSAISESAASIEPRELAIAFMEAAQEFLLSPTEAQRRYLASISQGFFLYHLFGLDPSCAKIRKDVLKSTIWWCDSNTLIPLLAKGCENHDYAVDLFSRLKRSGAHTLTTSRLLEEVQGHLNWTINFIGREKSQSVTMLEAATEKAGYKQNLFLDGYIRLSAEGKVSDFSEYLAQISPGGILERELRVPLEKFGITVVNASGLEGFRFEDTHEIFELVFDITEERQRSATLRSNLQVEAEAEILHIIRMLRDGKYKPPFVDVELDHVYFLSQSRILDKIPPVEPISWIPEVLYRYVLSLPGEQLNPDLLQRCMLQEYFGAGVVVIDKSRYERFFGPSIDEANITYESERERYLKEFSSLSPRDLDSVYKGTPDLEKPIFVQQLGWRLADIETARADEEHRKAEDAFKRAREAEEKLARLELQRDANWKRRKQIRENQLAAEQRNAKDPKHLRKKQRQAKKKKRGK